MKLNKPQILSLEMKIKTLGPPPPPAPEAFLQPRGSIFWILGAQKSTSAAQGKHILDSGILDNARTLWRRPPLGKCPPHASSQCCRRSRRASERPPPRKGPENQGRATEARRTRPRRVFLTSREAQSRHGHGQRAGWWEGADLGVAAHARGEADTVSKKRQDIFCFGRDMQKAWSSISELLWHGKEGGRGDASSSTKANPPDGEK